jgi:hypothetical protein
MATPYAVVWTEPAIKSRQALSAEKQVAALDIIQELLREASGLAGDSTPSDEVTTYTDPVTMIAITYNHDTRKRELRIVHIAEPQVPLPPRVFISYSHRDRKWVVELRKSLDILERQQVVRIWADTAIKPGVEWLKAIEDALGSARLALCLVTPDFLHSTFITQVEVPALLEAAHRRGCEIFWVAVSFSVVAHTPLGRYQAVNDPQQPLDTLSKPRRNKVMVQIYEQVKEAVSGE